MENRWLHLITAVLIHFQAINLSWSKGLDSSCSVICNHFTQTHNFSYKTCKLITVVWMKKKSNKIKKHSERVSGCSLSCLNPDYNLSCNNCCWGKACCWMQIIILKVIRMTQNTDLCLACAKNVLSSAFKNKPAFPPSSKTCWALKDTFQDKYRCSKR